jgi:RNA polymerase sigma-70 factor (ECF subfamily)
VRGETASADDDRERVRRILDGDQGAFRALFDQFFPRLYRYALAHLANDHDEARDVVQQTFCRAIEKLDRFRGEAALYTWFCQICHHEIADRYRARGSPLRAVHLEDSPQLQAVLSALSSGDLDLPEVDAWRHDVGRVVQATLDRLPERYAEILEWKYVDELSVKDIASRLAVAPKAAESMLTRARVAFRAAIGTVLQIEDALIPPRPPATGA